MFSYLIQDVPPLAADVVLMARLRDGYVNPVKLRRPCRIGIGGPNGRVYRVIVCDAPVEKATLFVKLRELGFSATPSQVGMTVFTPHRDGSDDAWRSTQAPTSIPG